MNGKGPRAINRGWAVTLLGLAMGISSSAAAQGRQIDLNQFRPAELATDGFATSTPDGQGHARFGFQVWLDYSDDALEIAGQKVVHQQMTGHLMLSLGLADHLVLFVDMPYHFIIEESSGVTTGVTVKHQNVGDLYFGARFNFYGTREDVFQIGAQAAMTINTASLASSQQTFAGQVDKKPYLGGWFELLLNFNAGDVVRIPLQIGYKLGTQGQLLGVPPDVVFVGNEFTYGGGVLIMLGDDQFMISAEAFGRTAANSTVSFWSKNETPVEVLGGFKWLPDFGFTLGVGGSAGVTDGYGAPDWRAFGMLGYTMPADKKEPDADGDGIPDELDKCPTEAEDFDGFQDEDGCPDLDNDGDGVLDVDDKCPNDPEDMDGFEDEDGCPDPDNDGDGILDVDDQCPNDAGPPENHGCPDPDRDGDGVPDRIDNCPDEPGTIENHGCQEKQLVVIGAGQLDILEKVYFKKGSAKLQKRSWALLDNVAAVLVAHPEIEKIRVEGHSDKTGSLKFNMVLSKKRANTVVRYLVGRGHVSKSRLVAKGFGPKKPLIPNAKSKEEQAMNRRVEFHIVSKADPKD
ncbi:MAG: OmpA family protein [Deltaproteobacteria bacterium]|nr:OmpA family protein [Deltaproteobacteria bacterium]MBW2212350.1 OmpA family protein [Deltaproteobacteria bacterium]MBW2215242.1 OmpA family protein [Deltaproteobacteria bacterium]MBW2381318.1 OmpA family protein [Deltaproteobacteria bacterium]MBW2552057.1 OmpA family protein [Deltaproteobacteria bacterium]